MSVICELHHRGSAYGAWGVSSFTATKASPVCSRKSTMRNRLTGDPVEPFPLSSNLHKKLKFHGSLLFSFYLVALFPNRCSLASTSASLLTTSVTLISSCSIELCRLSPTTESPVKREFRRFFFPFLVLLLFFFLPVSLAFPMDPSLHSSTIGLTSLP